MFTGIRRISQTMLAQRRADPAAQQLEADVRRPADAEAYRQRATAEAEADANRSRAGSLAGGNEELIAAHRIVESLPELVTAAAQGLAASNLTVLNGTDGPGQIMTGLAGQGLTVLDALRRSTAAVPPATASRDGHDGSAAESSPARS